MDKLEQLWELQNQLNKGWYEKGAYPVKKFPPDGWKNNEINVNKKDDPAQMSLEYCRALLHEVIEVEDALLYKFWDKDQFVNWDEVRREIVDCWHFLISISQMAGLSAEDTFKMYIKKNEINEQRKNSGNYSTSSKKNKPADDSHISKNPQ